LTLTIICYYFICYYSFISNINGRDAYSIESLNTESYLSASSYIVIRLKKWCGTFGKVKIVLKTPDIFGEKAITFSFKSEQFDKGKDSVCILLLLSETRLSKPSDPKKNLTQRKIIQFS